MSDWMGSLSWLMSMKNTSIHNDHIKILQFGLDTSNIMNWSILLLLLVGVTLQDSVFNRVMLPASGDALCLDGSPGAYYVSEGSGANKNKFVLYFQGGGWCGSTTLSATIDNCYKRSLTDLGSSKNYGPSANLDGSGLLSGNQAHNPGFFDWTRVYLKYCDGSGHQGTRSQPLNYMGKDLYFRGQNVTMGQLKGVNATHKLFSDATDIMVTGGSAGGLAAFLWTNYIVENAKGRVVSVPDSGIFLDAMNIRAGSPIYRTQFINLMKISNLEVDTPVTDCNKFYGSQIWRCMFAENIHPFIKAPLFSVQPLYDSWSIPNILGISCVDHESLAKCNATDRTIIQDYHKSTVAVLNKIVQKKGNGAWAPACANHCYVAGGSWTDKKQFAVPVNSEFTVQQSVRRWYQDKSSEGNHIHIDSQSWPSNTGCSGSPTYKAPILREA